ncbi:TIGR02391 family protein [Amycolatopsis australiensis]|uniref:TIGR02391 family protein n=1 Tax=Amycolatopsis australiensis TaxID=546364 RepID=A0A1K1T636_9PSEU|nr:TIGR02391 family protein [Amycolatopsis australiensis]SFW92034.1 TIGR02391 family protein [Amycolatopsis australiensis]
MPQHHSPWDSQAIEGVADVLGETRTGLSGPQIGSLLAELRIPDPLDGHTKRLRLRVALQNRQDRDGASNCIIAFITKAMAPVRYRDNPGLRTLRQDALNEVLVYEGLRVNDEGKIARGPKATTLSQAAQHANNLRNELRRRSTHPDVLLYCTAELLMKNSFHARLEATKSVFDKIRALTGLSGDGASLVDAALALGRTGTPRLAINSLATQTEKDEQTGLANLIKGLSSMFRNPVAHDPRLHRTVTDDELLEVMTTLSMVHRRLDAGSLLP